MISLEQVRALEARVEKAVALIASLRAENASLKDGLLEAELRTEAAEARTAELEGLIKEFQKDQERIEEGIVQALRKLDSFEDVVHAATKPPAVPAPTAAKTPDPVQPLAPGPETVPETSASGLGIPPSEHAGFDAAANTDTSVEDGATVATASLDEDPASDQSDGLDIF